MWSKCTILLTVPVYLIKIYEIKLHFVYCRWLWRFLCNMSFRYRKGRTCNVSRSEATQLRIFSFYSCRLPDDIYAQYSRNMWMFCAVSEQRCLDWITINLTARFILLQEMKLIGGHQRNNTVQNNTWVSVWRPRHCSHCIVWWHKGAFPFSGPIHRQTT